MSQVDGYTLKYGTAEASNGAADQTVIAALGSGKVFYLTSIALMVTVAAGGGGGEAAIEDGVGGTRIIEVDADAVGAYCFVFGPTGYPMTANTILNLTVDGAGGTQANARATVTGYMVG
jgi:hypothetical protein